MVDVVGSASIEIGPSLDGFVRDLEARLRAVDVDYTIDVGLDDTDMAGIERRLDSLARDRTVNIDTDRSASGLRSVASAAENAHSSLNAMSAVKFGALAAGITALIPAIGGVAAAAGAAGGAIAAIGGVVGVGGSGIVGAFQAMSDASTSAGADAVDSARQQQDALDSLSDAQQRLADAQRTERDALQAITDARKDAKDALDNLNLSVQQGALSERGAELSYQRAVQRLQDVQARAAAGRATQLDIDEAALNVDQAAQNITDVRVRNQQTGRRATEANAAGVEGSAQVVQAQQGLADAQQNTASAARDLARAQEDLATQAASAGAGADKLAEALAKLSPNAREFVLAMQALGPAWSELRLAVQDNLFAGLGDSVTQLANQHLPALQSGMEQLATSLNGAIKDTLGELSVLFAEMTESGAWQAFIDAVGKSMEGMAPFVANVVEALTRLTTIVGPTIGPLFEALGEGLNTISGPLGTLGAEFVTQITNLMPTLAQFISALAQGLQPVLPVLQQLLTALGQALIPILPYLSEFLQIIGNALVAALPVVSQLLVQLLQALQPLFQESGIGNQVLATMAQVFGDLITAITPVVQEIANNLQPVIPILMEAFRQIAPHIGDVAIALGTALADALRDVGPLLPGLVESFTNMLIELAPLLPKLTEFALEILPPLIDAATKVADPLQRILDLFAAIFDWVDKLVGPLTTVVDKINSLTDNSITRALIGTLGPVGATVNGITGGGGGGGNRVGGGGFAAGGGVSGGTPGRDSVAAMLMPGEHVFTTADVDAMGGQAAVYGFRRALHMADGGAVVDNNGEPLTPTQLSMWNAVSSAFPGATLNDGPRPGANDFHGAGKAIDLGGPMQAIANWIASSFSNILELFWDPGPNFDNGQPTSAIGGHSDHVHWAMSGPVGASAQRGPTAVPGQSAPTVSPTGTYVGPGAPGSDAYLNSGVAGSQTTTYPQAGLPGRVSDKELSIRSAQAQVDSANSRRNSVYANPNATQADKDAADLAYLQAQNSLESTQQSGQARSSSDLSLQGFGAKAGTIAANAVLGFFGLQNSVLSSSNVYNRAANSVLDFYNNPQEQGTSGGYGYTPQNLPQSSYQSGYSGVAPGGASAAGVTPNGVAPNYTPGAAVTESGVKGIVQGVFGGYGWGSGSEWEALDQLVSGESSWNPNAQNPSSTAYGLFQFLDTTWATVGGSKTSDPALQAEYGARYIKQRYGTPSGAWSFWQAQSPHWYDDGGIASGMGVMLKNVIQPERVLDPEMTRSFDTKLIPILESMRGWSPRSPEMRRHAPGRTSPAVVNNFNGTQVGDYRELMHEADRKAAMASIGAMAALPG